MGDAELILVVEDNDQVRKVTLARLESLGYTVEAHNGPEAVEILKSESEIELVLSDVVKPGGMSGYDIAKWIQTQRPSVKVLLASGYNEIGAKEGSELPMLAKPYTRATLARAVRDLLDA
jgi:CheY-like chemotaxis protein